jgi:epoxyqueuosine reductase
MKLTNELAIRKAKAIGFDLVGFTKVEILASESAHLRKWLKKGFHGDMSYMGKNIEKRADVTKILPGAKSIISLGLNYYSDEKFSNDKSKGKISRYAWGKDYHLIIWEMLNKLENELKEIDSSFESRSYVDTGPVMDKAWAVRAGLGWLGKHTNVINKEIGSWFFIANIISNYEFDYSEVIPDFCGSCTACIDACPTNAIIDEYILDSNKCISYLTIENKREIPGEFDDKLEGWLFGCDICQDVCPWNIKFSQVTNFKEFSSNKKITEIEVGEVLSMTKEEFKIKFSESPLKRTKLTGLKRNAKHLK